MNNYSSIFNIVLLAVLTLFGVPLLGTMAAAQENPNRQLVQTEAPLPTISKRVALIIGNGAYANAPGLKNPPNDARDMAATLRTLGFDVSSGVNLNQRDMKKLIREFGMKLKGGGSGLFYYAGHGVQSKGRNYLIPVDAHIQSEAEVEDSAVDAALVLNFMDDAQNGLNIVILDACRNNPFARSFRSATDGLAQVDAPTGTLIAYATAPGRVASDGAGQNGLYTSELLKQMQVPGVSITDMFMRVRAEVMKQTGSKQVPWEASSLVGSFYFSGGTTTSASPITSRIDPTAFELSYWDTVKHSQNADDFKTYLQRYPNGQFADLAKNRIRMLEIVPKSVDSLPNSSRGEATEIAFWDSIKNSTVAEDYNSYLKKYPNGEFADLAKSRLKPLEAALALKEQQEQAKRAADAEYARTHKSFKVLLGRDDFKGFNYITRIILVSPAQITGFYVDKNHNPLQPGAAQPCSWYRKAKLEGNVIRSIYFNEYNGSIYRYKLESPAEAASVLEAIQNACNGK